MGILQMMMSGGALEEQNYWYANIGHSSDESYVYGADADSSGNVYMNYHIGGTDNIGVAKWDKDGSIQWQNAVETKWGPHGMAVTSSGDVYSVGTGPSWPPNIIITKYNSSGAVQWRRNIGNATKGDECRALHVDSSGNTYMISNHWIGLAAHGTGDIPLIKYDSSGTLQWRKLIGKEDTFVGNDVVTDSSGNVIIGGASNSGGKAVALKLNSSAALQWEKYLESSVGSMSISACGTDSSDNVYFGGLIEGTYPDKRVFLLKYNSAGTLQWQREISGTGPTGYGNLADPSDGIAVDSDGNIYYSGQSATSPKKVLLWKWNSSGYIQWQRSWSHSSSTDHIETKGISVLKSHSFYFSIHNPEGEGSSVDALIVKLPTDGTLTAPVDDWVYESITYTEAAGTATESDEDFSISDTTSISSGTTSGTESSTTLVQATTPITGINVAGSVEFDGTGDYCSTGSSSDFTMGTGDFTVECFITKADSSHRGIWQISSTSGGLQSGSYTQTLALGYQVNRWQLYAGGSQVDGSQPPTNGAVIADQWYHLAVVRNSGTTKLYVDGVEEISTSDTYNYTGTYMAFGGYYNTSYLHYGNISNLRVIKGTALYTSNFTPSTSALTNITNTKLLCCQSDASATTDNSDSSHTITANGNATAVSSDPF